MSKIAKYLREFAMFGSPRRDVITSWAITPKPRLPRLPRLPKTRRGRKKWAGTLRPLTINEIDRRSLTWPRLLAWFAAHPKWAPNRDRQQAVNERRGTRRAREQARKKGRPDGWQ